MCGIVGGVAERNVVPILIEGLRRLEYRGYDSAGLAVLNDKGIDRARAVGKVQNLADLVAEEAVAGVDGIAHTRWATHGKPAERNAHPHVSEDRIVLVHNGIIENAFTLREALEAQGVVFASETDTEVVVHLLALESKKTSDWLQAVKNTLAKLHGSFALAILNKDIPGRMIVAREGSPLVIGLGFGEKFVASDQMALLLRDYYLEKAKPFLPRNFSIEKFSNRSCWPLIQNCQGFFIFFSFLQHLLFL